MEASTRLTKSIDENLRLLKGHMAWSGDVHTRNFRLALVGSPRAAVVYVHSIIDEKRIEEHLLHPLTVSPSEYRAPATPPVDIDQLMKDLSPILSYHLAKTVGDIHQHLVEGFAGLMVEGYDAAAMVKVQEWHVRAVSEPATEASILGPHEGFTESLEYNLNMVRRRLKDRHLVVEMHRVGTRSMTNVALAYVEDIAPRERVEEIRSRLKKVNFETVADSSFLKETLGPHRWTYFPLFTSTERPDRTVSGLLEGRVGILVNNDPKCCLVPAVFQEFFWASDDYYYPAAVATLIRGIRTFAVLIVLFLPALYVTMAAFNPDLVRVELSLTVAGTREGVPLRVWFEVLLMELLLEIFQEATIRLPSLIGTAATVVGGLIIGQAAAQARLISNLMVIVISAVGISSFTIPNYSMALAIRFTRWFIDLATLLLGFFGLGMAGLILIVYLNSLESLGVPYLAPYSPIRWGDLRTDSLVRAPWWRVWKRAATFTPVDKTRGPRKSDEGGKRGV